MNEKNDFHAGPDDVAVLHAQACEVLGFNSSAGAMPMEFQSFSKRIEHTLLRADSADADLVSLCGEASEHRFRSVCCLPRDVPRCRALLAESGVLLVTVINFPLAGNEARVVELECKRAIDDGADELDTVVDLRALRCGDLNRARDGIAAVVGAAGKRPVKVILETGLLTRAQIVQGAAAAEAAGASYVKTSTGFGPRGASVEDVLLLRASVGRRLGIKASGGIKKREFAVALVEAGADLIGTSAGPACV